MQPPLRNVRAVVVYSNLCHKHFQNAKKCATLKRDSRLKTLNLNIKLKFSDKLKKKMKESGTVD